MVEARRARAPGRLRPLGGDAAPGPDAEFVGASVRELRVARQLTLQELAGSAGLSVGHLSQVERGLSSPSVDALRRIAQALGVTIGWFFRVPPAREAGNEGAYIVRAGARRRLLFDSGITDELLSPHLGGRLEAILSRFAPGSSSGPEPYTHRGEEVGVVVEGALELWIDGELFELRVGDSFAFPSTKPHRYRNPTDREAVVVWVVTPPTC
jgi:transcriptional regulator with XRE-family HTH domain